MRSCAILNTGGMIMKFNFFYLLLTLTAFLPFHTAYAGGEKTFEGAEAQNYYQQLENQIAKEEKHVKELQAKATDTTHMPMWIDKLELEQAIIMLDVKKILYNNFRNTPALQSSLVREKLLSLLSRENITQGDLAELQSLANSEKQHLYEEQRQQLQQQQQSQQPAKEAPQENEIEMNILHQ